MKFIFLFLFALQHLYSYTIDINKDTNTESILEHSSIYFDKSKNISFSDLKNKNFLQNKKETLNFVEDRNFDLWIKFKLRNNSTQNIHKILALNYSFLYEVVLYDETGIIRKDGLSFKNHDRTTIYPSFEFELNKNEEKTYFIKINSLTTGIIANLKIYDDKYYNTKDLHFQIINSLFFGALLILVVYNLFLFFYTNDKSYVYYTLSTLSMILYQFFYLGFAELYIFTHEINLFLYDSIITLGTLQMIFVILFVRSFLNTKDFPKLDKLLQFYLLISILISILTYRNILFDSTIIVIFFPLYFLLILVGIYSMKKGNTLAKFYLLGWGAIVSSWMFMMIEHLGIFNLFEYIPYYTQGSILLEATIFSIALAKRITILQDEKVKLNSKLIDNEKNEKERLSIEVMNKTKDLNKLLEQKSNLIEEKEVLFKELYHRVKNNMQLIISLMRLQKNKFKNEEVKSYFQVAIERIQAMSSVHMYLYKDTQVTNQNTQKYFELLLKDLEYTYSKKIKIHYNIKSILNNDHAIYCALIMNELVSNSYKHAFDDKNGNIFISLVKVEDTYILEIEDDGKGYDKDTTSNLGLLIIKTLVESQLNGTVYIHSYKGVKTLIKWKEVNE
jgi:two-component sensor histidine kinase